MLRLKAICIILFLIVCQASYAVTIDEIMNLLINYEASIYSYSADFKSLTYGTGELREQTGRLTYNQKDGTSYRIINDLMQLVKSIISGRNKIILMI